MSNPADVNRAAVDRLKAAIQAKRKADRALANIESAICAYEGSYLIETSATGNIIKGFENYLKPTAQQVQRRNNPIVQEHERLFSMSSVTYQESLEFLAKDEADRARAHEQRQLQLEAAAPSSSAAAAHSHPPTPNEPSASTSQKKRKREQREESVMTGDGDSVRGHGVGHGRKKNRVEED